MAPRAVKPLLVIVGPTASGKTSLAIELALKFDGEVMCADSRTIYTEMDIATAKPSPDMRSTVPHHLLDVVLPGESFTVADFQQRANSIITEIRSRDRLPILVGGSGLYVDAVIYNYSFSQGQAPRDSVNPRHLRADASRHDTAIREDVVVVGLDVDVQVLRDRITQRVDRMFDEGLIDEAIKLAEKYGWSFEAMKTYLPLRGFLEGTQSLRQTKEVMIIKDLQVAKRQRTWFRRNNSIQWMSDPSKYVDIVTTLLNNKA